MINREELFKYVNERYRVKPEYLWPKFPNDAILRQHENNKWFAVVMNISAGKLGLSENKKLDIINVKCEPELIGSLRKMKGYLPAYHMNKDNWITILLDGSVDREDVFKLLDLSYELTAKKRSKKKNFV